MDAPALRPAAPAYDPAAMEALRRRRIARAEGADPLFQAGRWPATLLLTLLLLRPLAYGLGWLGLPGDAAALAATAAGRDLLVLIGPAGLVVLYWCGIGLLALLGSLTVPLLPLLLLGGGAYWLWTGLHRAGEWGWIALQLPPLPLP